MSAYDDLYKEYKKMAKRADERLRSLERASGRPGYRDALKFAYARAQYDIKAMTGMDKEKGRFDVKPVGETAGERYNMLQKMMASVKTFLNSETSTIGRAQAAEPGQMLKGIQGIYQQRAETTNKEWGTNFTWRQMATYWSSGLGEKMNEKFGSKTAMQKVADNPKKMKQIIRDIEKANKHNMDVSDKDLDAIIDRAFGESLSINDL